MLPPREIRKTVTLVFTDIKDSTALTGSIDAEAMNEIKARYFSSMGDQIREHGGEVEKNIGDAIMAVFGRIRAHEDDALRAVRAAHGMQAVLAEINQEFQRSYGVQITNRTGVNTGEIVANTDPAADQNLATGDAVNVAARLEQNAPAGEVLIGEITYELVAPHVDVERLDLVLKGKPDPVPAYRLIDVHDPVAAPEPDEPMVGRAAELATLREAYDAVASERRPRMVVISGDAGVGKTRLIADFVRDRSAHALVLRGRCLTYGNGITFWPLVEIVRSAAQILESDPVDTALAKITSLLPDENDAQAVVDRVASAIGLSTGDFAVTELIWGARKLLEAQTAERPLVVVVDDVHWAEATFLDLLDQLVGSPTPAPILVLCSSRLELADAHPDWWAAQEGHRIELAPLGAEAVEAMIDHLLGDAALPPEARERVVTAAEGNPLYVEQIVSMLRDRDPDDTTIVVPATITALLAARLDALSQQERAVIEPASVIGLLFPAPAIAELVPPPLRPEVGSHLETLGRKHLIRAVDDAGDAVEEDSYRFHHVLVKDATYQSLLKRARAQLHEQFADWAEPLNRERGRELEFEEIVAYHLEQAVRYRSELGPLDEHGRELAERAATRLSRSGIRALDRSDTPAAVNLLQRAVALMDERDPRRLELVPELGEALMGLSRFEEAESLLAEAATAADDLGDRRLSSRIRLRRLALDMFGMETSETPADAESEAREILSTLTALGDHGGAARAWRLLLLIHGNEGQYDELAGAAQHLIDEAGRANEPRLVRQGATGYAIGSVLGSTPVAEALEVCRRVLVEVGGDRRA